MLDSLGCYVFACCLAHIVYAQERAIVTVSSPYTPVYTGERVTLTCSYGAKRVLSAVTLDAFNGTRREGSLSCFVGEANATATTATGVLAGQSFAGCPPPALARATNVSISLTATQSLALRYNCTAVVFSGNQSVPMVMTSASTPLEVWVLPTIPKFEPSGLVLNESEHLSIICNTHGGSPVPVVRTTIISPNGRRSETNGTRSTKTVMPMPLRDWLNATATCVVLNHNLRNITTKMTTTSPVVINYIFSSISPPTVFTSRCNSIIDCSTYVSSFPSASYKWSTPSPASAIQTLLLRSPVFTVLQGQSGLFNCTATNSVTMKTVVVVFTVTNSVHSADDSPACVSCWIAIVAAVVVIGIVIAAVLLVLFKRGAFPKRETSSVNRPRRQPGVLSTNGSDVVNPLVSAGERQYASLRSPTADEEHYTQLNSNNDAVDHSQYANVTIF